jgi:signal transduction histidine kinase
MRSLSTTPPTSASDPSDAAFGRGRPVPPTVGTAARAHAGVVARALEVPLLWKLVGANALVLLAALVALGATQAWRSTATIILLGALLVGFALNLVLVWLALRPLAGLEETARRVWLHGDFAARVPRSSLADRNMARIGRTLNLLLDGLTEDRARMRLLASEVIRAQDAERARIARELHDSTAQTLAAAKLQLHAATQATDDPAVAERLTTLRELVSDALEETRSLSHLLYPRVLDDLGLVAALEWLARHARESGALEVEVETDVRRADIPKTAASVLYRVAQEGLRNAMTHAQARVVTLRVESDDDQATLEVADDGRGFDVVEAEARRPGMGLFAVRERVGLVDGEVEIYSVPGRGTRLSATVPLRERRD